MANLLQSSQNKTTTAPDYYNNYLSTLATSGTKAAQAAQYVGAQPLQDKAFSEVCSNFGAQQPAITTGQGLVGQAANQDVTGAAAPYLQAGTGSSPLSAMQPYAQSATCTTGYQAANPLISRGANTSGLCAAQPYLQQATGTSPADLAAQYMNPYLNTAVQSMSDIANRNIQNNIMPQANAGAVGSGQFGSQRNAQVAGQSKANALQDLNSQIAQMMASGYGQALCAAGKQNALVANAGSTAGNLANQGAQNQITAGTNLGNLQQGANQISAGLGSTAANAQNAQNQANLTAAQTASQAAANQGQLLNQSGQNMGNLAQTGANMNLACINALATLGGQQQTIGQNGQNYNLSKLASLSGLMQGQSIPTGTKTTLCMSPLSGLGAVGAGAAGILNQFPDLKTAISGGISGLFNGSGNTLGGQPSGPTADGGNLTGGGGGVDITGAGTGAGRDDTGCTDCIDNTDYGMYTNPNGFAIGGYVKGCASTAYRGGLPTKKG